MIAVKAYNLETVLAEKIETILSRVTLTTRMRDYYDLYILTLLNEKNINFTLLIQAFKETALQRGTYSRIKGHANDYFVDLVSSPTLANHWERYRIKNNYAYNITWVEVLDVVKSLLRRTELI